MSTEDLHSSSGALGGGSTRQPEPLLQGEAVARAWRAIDAIADDCLERIHRAPDFGEPSLAGGLSGAALFLVYLARAKDDEALADGAFDLVERAIEGAEKVPLPASLIGGLGGVSWICDHLEVEGFVEAEEAEEEVGVVDELVSSLVSESPAQLEYDLVGGLAGFGIAALEGLPRAGAEQALRLVAEELIERQDKEGPDAGSWFTPPEQLPEWQRQEAPNGYRNLGVAHGMPAVLLVLALALRHGVIDERHRAAVDQGVKWLLAQELPADSPSCFGSWMSGLSAPPPARSAWCYGDPGVAAALFVVADALEEAGWRQEALRIAHRVAQRAPDSAQIIDPGLCHGGAGLAHILHRLYRESGEAPFADAARAWFDRTLDFRKPDVGYGGFQAWMPPRDDFMSGELGWQDDPGMLTGAVGVGLALLAAVTGEEPAWDRSLGISGRLTLG